MRSGTWAGQDLANTDHTVPTIVCSTADALRAGIIKSLEDSGYDHIHARIDPTRYKQQIQAFHDLFGFQKLGVAFEDSVKGRSYAAIADIETVAQERHFEVIECHSADTDEIGAIACARELAPQIDAFYLTLRVAVNPNTLPEILAAMNAYQVPTFSQLGSQEVRHGVLLSVAKTGAKDFARFHAETIAKIINGAKPRL